MHTNRTADEETTIAVVSRVLEGMGIPDVSPESVISAPPFYDGRVLLEDSESFSRFIGQLAVQLRFIGYPLEEVAFLTVRELCEMYLRDSHPKAPEEPLTDDQYTVHASTLRSGLGGAAKDLPICFVLGAPRSGTTLLRVMLDLHSGLWAPGELHLATFETMSDRADNITPPLLRYMPIPEIASRRRESVASFSSTFRSWEREGTPITEVYEALHEADPDSLIVDKSPPYCQQLRYLERIGERLPKAKFIHLVRNPHDVIRSFVRLQLHRGARRFFELGRNPYQIAEAVWFACTANSETFLRGIPADRQYTLRYEDLVADPAPCLGAVCDLLGRAFESDMADPYAVRSGAIARGAGDLHIHLLKSVENRDPIGAFYPLGKRSQSLLGRIGY